eukprot:gb/GECG01007816.1/.p1 GENE.gb/GECG01007816.1/~~gb/GECG01007816.1/.p1  ORF type:complete len:185 (+),score=29.82 gb/GECG01007816.1/:1-555(+)
MLGNSILCIHIPNGMGYDDRLWSSFRIHRRLCQWGQAQCPRKSLFRVAYRNGGVISFCYPLQHMYHNVNFGLLMIADMFCGTHWEPGDPQPVVWSEAVKIWEQFPEVRYGQSEETGGTQHPDKIKKNKGQQQIFEIIENDYGKSKKASKLVEEGKITKDGGDSSSDDDTKDSCSDPETDTKKTK